MNKQMSNLSKKINKFFSKTKNFEKFIAYGLWGRYIKPKNHNEVNTGSNLTYKLMKSSNLCFVIECDKLIDWILLFLIDNHKMPKYISKSPKIHKITGLKLKELWISLNLPCICLKFNSGYKLKECETEKSQDCIEIYFNPEINLKKITKIILNMLEKTLNKKNDEGNSDKSEIIEKWLKNMSSYANSQYGRYSYKHCFNKMLINNDSNKETNNNDDNKVLMNFLLSCLINDKYLSYDYYQVRDASIKRNILSFKIYFKDLESGISYGIYKTIKINLNKLFYKHITIPIII